MEEAGTGQASIYGTLRVEFFPEQACRVRSMFDPVSQTFRVAVSGPPGSTGWIQRSVNLQQWVDWRPFTLCLGGVEVHDPDYSSVPNRFYRVIER